VPAGAQDAPLRADDGRFTVVYFPSDARLARSVLAQARARDTFPGLPRPTQHVLIAVAPDRERFRSWIGDSIPEWGAAIAVPAEQRIVMQGSHAGSDAGDPLMVLRHELAHLALHERLGDLPPRWFDEGYASFAAGEWGREEILSTSLALVVRPVPSLDSLDEGFARGSTRASATYALAYRAVADLAALDPQRGLSLFFARWREGRSMDRAVRSAYGLTLGQFEERWQQRTRQRYGALAFLASFSLAIALIGILVLPLYIARRGRQRERLAAMAAADEAAERRERERVLFELLGGNAQESGTSPRAPSDTSPGEPPPAG